MRTGPLHSSMRQHSPAQTIIEETGRFVSDGTGLVSPIIARGYAKWSAAGHAGALPKADDLKAEQLVGILPYVYLVDVIVGETGNAPDFRYRLVGTDVVSHTEVDNTGYRLSEIAGQGSQATLTRLYALAAEAGKPAVQRISYRTKAGSRHWYETIVMPLALERGGPVARLLGVAEHFSQSV